MIGSARACAEDRPRVIQTTSGTAEIVHFDCEQWTLRGASRARGLMVWGAMKVEVVAVRGNIEGLPLFPSSGKRERRFIDSRCKDDFSVMSTSG